MPAVKLFGKMRAHWNARARYHHRPTVANPFVQAGVRDMMGRARSAGHHCAVTIPPAWPRLAPPRLPKEEDP